MTVTSRRLGVMTQKVATKCGSGNLWWRWMDSSPCQGTSSLESHLSHFDQTSLNTQIRQTASFTFSSPPYPEAHVRYNLVALFVRYDLASFLGPFWYNTIWQGLLYDINLRATHTTILSIRGITIPIYLVSSTTDSIRRHVVLFKPVPNTDLRS